MAVLRYFNEVWKETTTKPFVHPDTVPANVNSELTVQKIGIRLSVYDLLHFHRKFLCLPILWVRHNALKFG